MQALGSLLRGIVLAVLIGAVSVLVGALIALFFCSGGACEVAEPLADLVAEPTPGLGGAVSTIALLAALLFLGLVIVLAPEEPVVGLAIVFAVLLAGVGFLLWLPRSGAEAEELEPLPEPEPAVAEERLTPVPEPSAERLPECPAGSFLENGECTPCEQEITAPAPAALRFEAVQTDAVWTYARETTVDIEGETRRLDAYVSDLAEETGLCRSSALLVMGSASADGARERNERRAKQRAENLAEAVRQACDREIDIYPLSLGQSRADEDVAADRAISILRVEPLAEDAIDGELILEELGYTLSAGGNGNLLLSHKGRFPQPWTGPSGQEARLVEKARPQVTTRIPTLGAPESCRVPERTGLDPELSLRQ